MDWPDKVPVMILPEVALFPNTLLPLYIFEPRYRAMVANALESHRMFCLAMQDHQKVREAPYRVAGLGLIRASVEHPDGTSHLVLQGLARVRLRKAAQYKPYRVHVIDNLTERGEPSVQTRALSERVKELVEDLLNTGASATECLIKKIALSPPQKTTDPTIADMTAKHILTQLVEMDSASQICNLVASTFLTDSIAQQSILETSRITDRLIYLIDCLYAEIEARDNSTNL